MISFLVTGWLAILSLQIKCILIIRLKVDWEHQFSSLQVPSRVPFCRRKPPALHLLPGRGTRYLKGCHRTDSTKSFTNRMWLCFLSTKGMYVAISTVPNLTVETMWKGSEESLLIAKCLQGCIIASILSSKPNAGRTVPHMSQREQRKCRHPSSFYLLIQSSPWGNAAFEK